MKYIFSILIISISLVSISLASEKQTRVNACIKVTKARIAQDQEGFLSLVNLLGNGTTENRDESTNKLLSLLLMTCYNKMTFYDADEINQKYRDYRRIKSKEQEFKDLLGLERWEQLFTSNDQQELNQEMGMIQQAMAEMKSEELNFDELNEGIKEDYEQPEAQDIHYTREKKMDFDIFGFNFTKMDEIYKYVLGIGLIFSVFFAVIYGLFWIKKMRSSNIKLKKPKKN